MCLCVYVYAYMREICRSMNKETNSSILCSTNRISRNKLMRDWDRSVFTTFKSFQTTFEWNSRNEIIDAKISR